MVVSIQQSSPIRAVWQQYPNRLAHCPGEMRDACINRDHRVPSTAILILTKPLAFPVILGLDPRITRRIPGRKCVTIQGCAGSG